MSARRRCFFYLRTHHVKESPTLDDEPPRPPRAVTQAQEVVAPSSGGLVPLGEATQVARPPREEAAPEGLVTQHARAHRFGAPTTAAAAVAAAGRRVGGDGAIGVPLERLGQGEAALEGRGVDGLLPRFPRSTNVHQPTQLRTECHASYATHWRHAISDQPVSRSIHRRHH